MLRESLSDALKTAMRTRDSASVGTLRLILAAIKDKDIAARPSGVTSGIGDAEILSLLQNMIKQRHESITLYKQGKRDDLVANETAEIALISKFLPAPLGAAEVDTAIETIIAEQGAKTIKDMGKVISELKQRYAGQIDAGDAARRVKAALELRKE